MMTPQKKCTAIKQLFALALLSGCATAFAAQVVGTVTDLNGPLFLRTANGGIKILAQQSSVEPGDTLVSEQDTYARIKFIDKSEITLRPNTQMKIEKFSFNEAYQENDHANIRLIKGGLRVASGLIGKRSQDRFVIDTPTSSINVRDASFIAQYIPDEVSKVATYRAASMAALDLANARDDVIRSDSPQEFWPIRMLPPLQLALTTPVPGAKSPGLYVQVLDGIINLSNGGGSQSFTAGQFGYTASFIKPPIVLPANPGMQFTPPPAFSAPPSSNSTSSNKSGTVDCEVR
ncbi:MAG TPA: FecR family protein [Burkholderiaceae bacterium]|jgi:hypothetical protein